MLKLLVLALCLGAVLAAPNVVSREEIEEYRKYLEKAKSTTNDSSFQEAMARNPLASPWENSGKFEGDIVLTDEDIEEMTEDFAKGRNAYVRPGRDFRWPGGVVVWAFAANHFTAAQQNQIRNAINDIQRHSCVRFRGRTANDRNYVLVTGANTGCWAMVGFHNVGRHTFNIGPGCFNHFVIIHEWLHTIGFNHMHQAYTRYDYIWINWHNMAQGSRFAFYRHPRYIVNMLGLPYEYASNQHYGPYAFSNNRQRTIGTRRCNGHLIGQLTHITHWDWMRVRRNYNCPGGWNEEVRAEDEGKPEEALPEYSRRIEPFTDTPVPEIKVDDYNVNDQVELSKEARDEIEKKYEGFQPLFDEDVNQEIPNCQQEEDQQEVFEQPAETQDQAF